jgi:hypothetical protein
MHKKYKLKKEFRYALIGIVILMKKVIMKIIVLALTQ